jgi:hypothetical protein
MDKFLGVVEKWSKGVMEKIHNVPGLHNPRTPTLQYSNFAVHD